MRRFIKNWNMFQHYKGRNPPWIKLYRTLLDDREWYNLDGDAAKALVGIWLIASENGGKLPDSDTDLAFRLRMTEERLASLLSRLSPWLTTDASNMLAPCYQHACPEERRGEGETETDIETEGEAEGEPLEESNILINGSGEEVRLEQSSPDKPDFIAQPNLSTPIIPKFVPRASATSTTTPTHFTYAEAQALGPIGPRFEKIKGRW